MKDNKFSAEYKKAVNGVSLPADYKEKILSALKEQDKKQEEENTPKTTEIIEFTKPEKQSEKETKTRNLKKFIPAIASVAAAIVIVVTAVMFFAKKPVTPFKTTFNFSVASATNLGNISGAQIVFRDSNGELLTDDNGEILTAYTDENGKASVTLPEGEEYTAQVTIDGYIPYETSAQNGYIYISPVMTEDTYRAVLTWEKESDLDAILTTESEGNKDRVFYFKGTIENDEGQVIAALDTDSQFPTAPETITFNTEADTTFRFSVASYSALKESDANNLANSGAQVVLYKGETLLGKYNVPEDTSGNTWYVFEIKDSQLEIKNEIYSVDAISDVR